MAANNCQPLCCCLFLFVLAATCNAMGSSMHTRTNSRKLSLSVQNFKCSFDNFDNRQVQLQQVIAHCIVMLEALQPQSLAVPDLSDCERSESGCLLQT